jgi:oligoribonuclease NrnB/cAMP/cGMP phosphodiesterase (DHH superfamily)
LDHHKKAQEVVEAFGQNGIFADEKLDPGVCGATLAYRHVWKPLREAESHQSADLEHWGLVTDLATLAGIRDTWQTQDARWVEACGQAEALKFWPLEKLLGAEPTSWGQLIQIGSVIFDRNLKFAQETAESSYRFTSEKGTRVALFGGLSATSDAAEALADQVDVVVGFSYRMDAGKVQLIFSTRSHTTYDVGKFCVAHGGGGHTKAAGFKVEVDLGADPNPFQHFKEILGVYEAR